MKQLISILTICLLFIGVSAQAQDWRIYYTSADQIRVDSANGGLHKVTPAKDLKIAIRGNKVGFTFSGFGKTLLPSQIKRADNTAYGTTVSQVITAFISGADLATDQVIITSTATGTLDSTKYSFVELENIHATVASSIVVGGNTVSIPAGKSVTFRAIRSEKTGRYKPIPQIAYTATGSSLRIYTIKE